MYISLYIAIQEPPAYSVIHGLETGCLCRDRLVDTAYICTVIPTSDYDKKGLPQDYRKVSIREYEARLYCYPNKN